MLTRRTILQSLAALLPLSAVGTRWTPEQPKAPEQPAEKEKYGRSMADDTFEGQARLLELERAERLANPPLIVNPETNQWKYLGDAEWKPNRWHT